MITKKFKYLGLVIFYIFLHWSCSVNKNNNLREFQSLSKIYENKFYVGSAYTEKELFEINQQSNEIIKKEFNSITSENSMKWEFIHPKMNKFDFEKSDRYVNFGLQNDKHIVGHTLVWHSQLPDYVKEIKDSLVLSNLVKNHINTIVNRYKGKIDTWDVVNEALNEDGTLRNSIFLKVLGKKYIENAFKFTAKADPKAELIYNDYNLCEKEKRDGAIKLIKSLQKNGAKVIGIGIQGHWKLNEPSLADIEKTIIAFSDIGVKVNITELDINVLPNPWELTGADVNANFDNLIGDKKMNPYSKNLPDSVEVKQAKRYEDIFKLFLKHEDKINRVTFWSVSDKDSWLNDWPIKGRTNYPMLFDRNYKPKKAYQSIFSIKN